MIYTITPNPALDIGGSVDKLVADEKNYVVNESRSAGGNGINSARIAHRLETKVIVSGFLGGATGNEVKDLLDAENIKHKFVKIASSTRINLTVTNQKTHSQTRLSFPGPPIQPAELKDLQKMCNIFKKNSIVVIGGSLPKGVTPKNIKSLIKASKLKGCFCIVDMPSADLKDIISCRPDFIKPNLHEFQELIGKKVKTIRSILPLARQLSDKVSMVCVSSVEGGALLVTKDMAWFGQSPKLKIRSSVGAGDSMVGAMATVLLKNKVQNLKLENREEFFKQNGSEVLRWGLSAASATLVRSGMVLGEKRDILKFYKMIKIKEV